MVSACQEMGVITPAPVNARKMIHGAWSIGAPVKKKKKKKPPTPFYSLANIAPICLQIP
jgi:hypothetical protein